MTPLLRCLSPCTIFRHSDPATITCLISGRSRWAFSSFDIRTFKHSVISKQCRPRPSAVNHSIGNATSSRSSPLAGACAGDRQRSCADGEEHRSGAGDSQISATTAVGVGLVAFTLLFPQASLSAEAFPTVTTFAGAEPSNALSLPTWVIHVASVAEWVTAMALVWRYGETKGNSAWKGLTWGMVPLLGGAMCACSWHFFYNAESLEVLVVLQAFLTVVGNFTMWAAAYRICKMSKSKVSAE